jgi:hypothetical protein
MSLYIPSDITNIIFEYYAQMRDMKWFPFIDVKTGKLIWKVNKYSTNYNYVNNVLKYRKSNEKQDMNIYVELHNDFAVIDIYETHGILIPLKKEYIVNKWNVITPKTTMYLEFTDQNNNTYNIMYTVIYRSALFRLNYDIYMDNTIFGELFEHHDFQENNITISMYKY